MDRIPSLLANLDLNKPGIEIAPLFRPTVKKTEADVFYVDVCSAEESRRKHSNHAHDEILDVDIVWAPGKRLIDCIPLEKKFCWGIASHVLEHVPDPLGWLIEVFETMLDGAVLSLALPRKENCFDRFRRDTSVADLIDAWVRGEKIPGPRQVFDFTSMGISSGFERFPGDESALASFDECPKSYTLEESLRFTLLAWQNGVYLDAHCSVFNPVTIKPMFEQFNQLGILNVEISNPSIAHNEFYIQLKRLGPSRIHHPGLPHKQAMGIAGRETTRVKQAPESVPVALKHPHLKKDLFGLFAKSSMGRDGHTHAG